MFNSSSLPPLITPVQANINRQVERAQHELQTMLDEIVGRWNSMDENQRNEYVN